MTDISHNKLLSGKISDFCRLRVDPVLPPQESARIKSFLLNLIGLSRTPPRSARSYDWDEIAFQCGLGKEVLRTARTAIEPALDAIVRNTKNPAKRSATGVSRSAASKPPLPRGRSSVQPTAKPATTRFNTAIDRPENEAPAPRQKPGSKPREIEEFPHTHVARDRREPARVGGNALISL